MVRLTLFEYLRTLPTPPGPITEDELARDTEALAERLRPELEASVFAADNIEELHTGIVVNTIVAALDFAEVEVSRAVIDVLCQIVRDLIAEEPQLAPTVSPPPREIGYAALLSERARLIHLRTILQNPERFLRRWQTTVVLLIGSILEGLPDSADGEISCETPLIDLIEDVPERLETIIGEIVKADELLDVGLFGSLSGRIWRNILSASNLTERQLRANPKLSCTLPTKQRNVSDRDLVEGYLGGTPLAALFALSWPVSIPKESRFEHHWIVAGSGHGKTQTLQYLISKDLERVAEGEASIIVIDSQGDLIRTISRCKAFAEGGALHDRLVLIDPTDIEYPVALNLFDVGIDRIRSYSKLDQERLINGVIELYDFVFTSLLSAELTGKQGVVFRYIMRLMLHIPDATIQTLRELMEPKASERFKPYIAKLTGTARAFFDNEFNSKQFEETKRQVARRLYGILENQTFERMFSHPRNKLNLFSEMNAGKVILINTAKELLKQQGTEIFGRFFVAMIAQAAQERATIKGTRLPCFVYIDECQDYVDTNVATILEQARKYKVGMILAHQYIGQLAPKLQESISANTSIKFAGGVSDKDARALAHMLRSSPEFIEAQPKGTFAAFIRNTTRRGIAMRFPFGVLESLPRMSKPEWKAVRASIRRKYSVRFTEVDLSISEPIIKEHSVTSKEDSSHIKPSTSF